MADGRGAPRDGAPDGSHGGEETPEDEPRLKYQRLGSSCAELLAGTAASCLRVEDKMLALGTQCGSVYLLDFNGNQVPPPAPRRTGRPGP